MALDLESLDRRLTALENTKPKADKADKAERAPRKQSEYNIFMKNYIGEQKTKGTTKSHKDLFAEGAKAWSAKKG